MVDPRCARPRLGVRQPLRIRLVVEPPLPLPSTPDSIVEPGPPGRRASRARAGGPLRPSPGPRRSQLHGPGHTLRVVDRRPPPDRDPGAPHRAVTPRGPAHGPRARGRPRAASRPLGAPAGVAHQCRLLVEPDRMVGTPQRPHQRRAGLRRARSRNPEPRATHVRQRAAERRRAPVHGGDPPACRCQRHRQRRETRTETHDDPLEPPSEDPPLVAVGSPRHRRRRPSPERRLRTGFQGGPKTPGRRSRSRRDHAGPGAGHDGCAAPRCGGPGRARRRSRRPQTALWLARAQGEGRRGERGSLAGGGGEEAHRGSPEDVRPAPCGRTPRRRAPDLLRRYRASVEGGRGARGSHARGGGEEADRDEEGAVRPAPGGRASRGRASGLLRRDRAPVEGGRGARGSLARGGGEEADRDSQGALRRASPREA